MHASALTVRVSRETRAHLARCMPQNMYATAVRPAAGPLPQHIGFDKGMGQHQA